MMVTVAQDMRVYTTYDVPDEVLTADMKEVLEASAIDGGFVYSGEDSAVDEIIDAIPGNAVLISQDMELDLLPDNAVLKADEE
ncbi:hypothetical protein [Brevibacterium moorei]|uniref:hypothetical protein n=1 Tax=Brevibacterium moorei TaxID=2968457 RepID=UPI00211D11ED|nr:hypothetical protein [Brevibacterium sp. 68QC2CO]MCQ9385139.1 hypothetical protein [Brevibacterium sp. 68QC2CO]